MHILTRSAMAIAATASVAGAQQLPPIRQLGPVVATSHDSVGPAISLRALSDGRVLVNDPSARRVVLLDTTLALSTVVADSTPATGTAYSGRIGGLIAWRGDSTLFVDPQSLSMLVVDPAGKLGRTMSVPNAQDAFSLTGFTGPAALDAAGRIVYRAQPRFSLPTPGPNGAPAGPPVIPDSAAVLRVDMGTRKVDTIGFTRTPKISFSISDDGQGRRRVTTKVNPLQVVDEWALLPDGSVALVRGSDYHVDWIAPDGARRSTPKVPHDWQRLSDEDKIAFIDSVKEARNRLVASGAVNGPAVATTATVQGGPAPNGGRARPAPDGGPNVVVRTGPAPAGGPGGVQLEFVDPSELPDYKPAFLPGGVRADASGNLWIQTVPTKKIPGGPVYDVVTPKGELAERVQVPVNSVIAGFGGDGSVFLVVRDPSKPREGVVERARVK